MKHIVDRDDSINKIIGKKPVNLVNPVYCIDPSPARALPGYDKKPVLSIAIDANRVSFLAVSATGKPKGCCIHVV
jgi:hypothetical protein